MQVLRNNICLLIITLFFTCDGLSQTFSALNVSTNQVFLDSSTVDYPPVLSLMNYDLLGQQKNDNIYMKSPYEHWGFICKWEVKNDMKSQIPLRMRLGTLDYVNKYESGKLH